MPISRERAAEYPPNWKEFSLSIRRDRAGERCECEGECGHDHKTETYIDVGPRPDFEPFYITNDVRCGAVQNVPHPVTDSIVVLTVAHLDHDHTHADPDRCKAMCQRCHFAYDQDLHRTNAARTRHAKKAIRDLFEDDS